jgi:hypothetical protein
MSLLRKLRINNPHEMRQSNHSPYGAVPVEENPSNSRPSSEFQYYTTIELPEVDEQKPQPQPLKVSQVDRISRLIWDLILAIVASLFTVFGIWVRCIDGQPAGPDSMGAKLFEVSQYVSCPDPTFILNIVKPS